MGTNADFKMDWDNVRIFLSVARAGQFSAAASQLRIDNGTVGRRINALEKPPRSPVSANDWKRADRRRRSVVRDYRRSRSPLLRAQGDFSQSDVELSGTVRLAAPDGFTTLFRCSRLGHLKTRYPSLTVQLVPMS